MKSATIINLFALARSVIASGLVGYGIPMYKPNCAFACRDQFSMAMLECTTMDDMGGDGMDMGMSMGSTSPECYAGNTPWLTTLAYCIDATCIDVPKFKLEAYWAERVTKDERGNQILPKWTYQETLYKMTDMEKPTKALEMDVELNFTALYDPAAWEASKGAMWAFELAETTHSRYA
jgi:hypothetical protein